MNNKAPSFDDSNVDCNVSPNQNLRQQHGQQQLGRQARRRLTNRPSQENLMNMTRGKERDCHRPAIPRGNHETEPMSINNSNNIIRVPFQPPFYSRGHGRDRALGEQHQMEWDDNMSPVTSVWRFNCLHQMEHNALEFNNEVEKCHETFDDELEFSLWEN
ncbi:hypothetical protein ACSQ67_000421 [Phaseolus vulgaris]